MGIAAAIKKGFEVAVKSLDLIFALFAFGLAWNGANLFYARQAGPDAANQPSPVAALLGGLFLLVSIFMQSGSLAYVRDRIKTGTASLAGFAGNGLKYYLRLLGAGLVMAVIAGVLIVVAGVAMRLLATAGVVIAVILGVVGVVLFFFIFLSPYVVVADEEKVFKAISKSAATVRGNVLAVLVLTVLLILIALGVGVLLGLILGLLSFAVKGLASQIVIAVLSSAVNAFLGTIVSGAFMSFYLSRGSNTTGA